MALVTEAYGGYGGIAQYNKDFVNGICEADTCAVQILARLQARSKGMLPKKATQSNPLFFRTLYSARAFYKGWKDRPDLIFCGHLYMAPMAMVIAQTLGVPFAVQLHGTEIWKPPTAPQRRALEKAWVVLCVSRHTRAQALKFSAADFNRVVVVSNTVGARFQPGDRHGPRSALGVGDEFVLLTVGRLDPRRGYKGHDRVIRALPRLMRGPKPVTYLISGEGEDRPRLEALAGDLGVRERVRFLGHASDETLSDLYRAADLFVMPSKGEGFGIVFLEAMASGTPALGLAVGGATDPLDFGDWGRAVTEDEFEDALCGAVARERPEPQLLHQAVIRRFGFDVFVEELRHKFVERMTAFAH